MSCNVYNSSAICVTNTAMTMYVKWGTVHLSTLDIVPMWHIPEHIEEYFDLHDGSENIPVRASISLMPRGEGRM